MRKSFRNDWKIYWQVGRNCDIIGVVKSFIDCDENPGRDFNIYDLAFFSARISAFFKKKKFVHKRRQSCNYRCFYKILMLFTGVAITGFSQPLSRSGSVLLF